MQILAVLGLEYSLCADWETAHPVSGPWKPAFKENLASFYRYVSITEGEIVQIPLPVRGSTPCLTNGN